MNYYQIKIKLKESKPPIYRKILINPETKLPKFHDIIQDVMGWTDSHLHHFIVDGEFYGEPDPDDWTEVINYKNIKIYEVLMDEKDKMIYEYDFGDSWIHEIILEKFIELDEEFNVKCIDGKLNCPPEDCGGISGYYNLLEVLSNPEDEEYEYMLEWLEEDFDPEYFNIDEVNEVLRYYNKKKRDKKQNK